MRALLFCLVIASSGCFFPTPLATPEPLPGKQTRVDAGIGLHDDAAVGFNVRHGVGDGVEVSARAAGFFLVQDIAAGVGVQKRLTASGAPTAVSVRLDGTYQALGRQFSVSPTVIAGNDVVYGGARATLPVTTQPAGVSTERGLYGGFVGVRVPVSKLYVGAEVFVGAYRGADYTVLAPTLTFGLAPNRSTSGVPSPGMSPPAGVDG